MSNEIHTFIDNINQNSQNQNKNKQYLQQNNVIESVREKPKNTNINRIKTDNNQKIDD